MQMIRDNAGGAALDTVEAVIEALGGRLEVVRLTGRSPQQVSNWLANDRFSPMTFLVMTRALEARGVSALPRLWRMDEPQISD